MIDKISFIDEKSGKEYNSYDDFNFLIKDFSVDEATVKEEIVDIPRKQFLFRFFTKLDR